MVAPQLTGGVDVFRMCAIRSANSSRLSCWPPNVSHIVADVRRGRPGPTPVPAERS